MTAQVFQAIREHPIVSGWVGASSSFFAVGVQQLEHINAALSTISLVVGIIIALLTLPATVEKFLEWVRRKTRKKPRA